jgi:hypothetical protein
MKVRLPNPMSAAAWAAFLLPALFPGAWADRAFGAAALVLAGAALYAKPSPWEAREPSGAALRFFLPLQALCVISALYAAGVGGASLGLSGWLELPRWAVFAALAVYVIRHFDDQARSALDLAASVAPYVALAFPSADPQGYTVILALSWLLFFSRRRLRFLHATAALLAVFFSGDKTAWTAAYFVLAVGAALFVYRARVRRPRAARTAVLAGVALLALPFLRRLALPPAPSALSTTEAVAWQFVRRSPVFGWGPVEAAAVVGRSQYVFWLLKGGALAGCVILAGLLSFAWRLMRASRETPTRLAGAAAFLGSAAWMLTAGRFMESDRLFFMTALFAAGMSEERR